MSQHITDERKDEIFYAFKKEFYGWLDSGSICADAIYVALGEWNEEEYDWAAEHIEVLVDRNDI